jgi:hypothetical protein
MSDLKLEKSNTMHKLKIFSIDDVKIVTQDYYKTDGILLKDKLEVSLYEFSSHRIINYTSTIIKRLRMNHFLSKYIRTNILKVYGIIENKDNYSKYIVYEHYDFTLQQYFENKYNLGDDERNIPILTINNIKNILLQITQILDSINSLGYDMNYIYYDDIVFIKNNTTKEYSVKLRFCSNYVDLNKYLETDIQFIGLDIDAERKDYNIGINEIWNSYKFGLEKINTLTNLFILFLDESSVISRKENIEIEELYQVIEMIHFEKKDNNFMIKDTIINEIILEKYGNDGVELLKKMFESDVKLKINIKQILAHSFWKSNLKGGSSDNSYNKFTNSIKDRFNNIPNCDSCSSIPISKEIYKKKLLETTYFEEIHQNYRDIIFKEDSFTPEMRIHLYKVFENVFKFINVSNIKNVDEILIKELDAFINASMYIRMFVNLKQKMEISVLTFLALWSIFSKKSTNIFFDYYNLDPDEDYNKDTQSFHSDKFIQNFNESIDLELLLNIEYIPITTHLNYIISKLSYETKEEVVSQNIINFDLVPVYLNICQYYTSIPEGTMDYFSVYEICVIMLISTPLFIDNFSDYDTIDKFIEEPPYNYLNLDLVNSRKFIERFMRAKKTLFSKLPNSSKDTNLIVDYDFIHLTKSLLGDKILVNNQSKISKVSRRASNNTSNNTQTEILGVCNNKNKEDCDSNKGCQWLNDKCISKENSVKENVVNHCIIKGKTSCKEWFNGCKWLEGIDGNGTCFLKQDLDICDGIEDCDSNTKCHKKYDKCVPSHYEQSNEIKPTQIVEITKEQEKPIITKQKVELANNKCSIKDKDDCKSMFNGCKWLEETDTDGTCFLKDDLNICDDIKIEDCNSNTKCHKKYNKCVPNNYKEATQLKPTVTTEKEQVKEVVKPEQKTTELEKPIIVNEKVELANNKCSVKNSKECKTMFNGCKWLEGTEGMGTCFLKDDLELCHNIKIEDCDKNTKCNKKYNKCVPNNYKETDIVIKQVETEKPKSATIETQKPIATPTTETQKPITTPTTETPKVKTENPKLTDDEKCQTHSEKDCSSILNSCVWAENKCRAKNTQCEPKNYNDCKTINNNCKWIGESDNGKCYPKNATITKEENCKFKSRNNCIKECEWNKTDSTCVPTNCDGKDKTTCSALTPCEFIGSDTEFGKCFQKTESSKLTKEQTCNLKNHRDCTNMRTGYGCNWFNNLSKTGQHCHQKNYKPTEETNITTPVSDKNEDCHKIFDYETCNTKNSSRCKWKGSVKSRGKCFDKSIVHTKNEECNLKDLNDCESLIKGRGCSWDTANNMCNDKNYKPPVVEQYRYSEHDSMRVMRS